MKAAFPKINIVLGSLDDSKVLEEDVAKADVVIRKPPNTPPLLEPQLSNTSHTAESSVHEGAAKAIAESCIRLL